MDEESARVKTGLVPHAGSSSSAAILEKTGPIDSEKLEIKEESPAVEVNRLRTEIDFTRDELGVYISELDRRRHEIFNLKAQLKKHPGVVLAVGLGLVAAAGGAVALTVRSRRRKTLRGRAQQTISRVVSSAPPALRQPSRLLEILLKAAVPFAVGIAKGIKARKKSVESAFS